MEAQTVSQPRESAALAAGLLTEADAAGLLGVKVQTLRKWSVQRKGPARVKAGRRVLYRRTSLEAWVIGQERDPAAA